MDIFSSAVLARVVAALPAPSFFFLNSFFRDVQEEQTEEIHFDVENSQRRLAPFVSPLVAGKVVREQGFTTKVFSPAYVKPKGVFDANRAFKRAMGERIGGSMTPSQRLELAVANALMDHIEQIDRRQEVMAVEALRTGKVVVVGDEYPEVEVDFGRAANLTKALLTTARWGESGVSPLNDIRDWSLEVTQASGSAANVVVMDAKAFKLFNADAEVQTLLNRFRGADMLAPTVVGEGGRYMGSVGEFDIWVHAGWYKHPTTGMLTPYMPDHTVIVTSADLEGTRCFGAIKDEEAGFQAMAYFSKSWVEKDPSARMLLTQSAPLPVPYRVNASMCATVR